MIQEGGFDDVIIYGGGGGRETPSLLDKGSISCYYHLKSDY